MGLFDGIGNFFSNGLNTIIGGQGASEAENKQQNLVQQNLDSANANIDQSQNVQDQLTKNAQKYRGNIPAMSDSYAGLLGDQQRKSFANQLQANTSAANNKGLLYSGIKQGWDSSAAGDYASNLAAGRNQINNELNDQSNNMDKAAVSNGMNVYQQRQNLNDIQYKNMLTQRALQAQQAQSIGSGVGGLLGTVGGMAGGKVGGIAGGFGT